MPKPLGRAGNGAAQNYNCGVLYLNRDVSAIWRETFNVCAPILESYVHLISPPGKYAAGAENTFGQGIWNILFSALGGKELNWKWNNLRLVNPDRHGVIDHYAVDKEALLADATQLGWLE